MKTTPFTLLCFLALSPIFLLYGCCDRECRADYQKRANILQAAETSGKAVVVSTAPDGTKLYKAYDHDERRWIYYSVAGTQTEESCGKGCTRPEVVPSAQ